MTDIIDGGDEGQIIIARSTISLDKSTQNDKNKQVNGMTRMVEERQVLQKVEHILFVMRNRHPS